MISDACEMSDTGEHKFDPWEICEVCGRKNGEPIDPDEYDC